MQLLYSLLRCTEANIKIQLLYVDKSRSWNSPKVPRWCSWSKYILKSNVFLCLSHPWTLDVCLQGQLWVTGEKTVSLDVIPCFNIYSTLRIFVTFVVLKTNWAIYSTSTKSRKMCGPKNQLNETLVLREKALSWNYFIRLVRLVLDVVPVSLGIEIMLQTSSLPLTPKQGWWWESSSHY